MLARFGRQLAVRNAGGDATAAPRRNRWAGCVRALLLLISLSAVARSAEASAPKPATDEEIAAAIASTGNAKDFDNAELVYVLDEADVFVQPSGLATTEACQVFKVLTDAGVRSRSVLRWEFDPDTYRVTVKRVRIHRAAGGVEEVDLKNIVTQPSVQHMIYWGGRQHLLSLPRLEVGDSVEVRTSKIGFNIAYLGDDGRDGHGELIPPMAGHWFEVTLFQGPLPIRSKRYSVHMPKEMPLQYEVYNGPVRSSLWFGEGTNVHTWSAENIPVTKSEPSSVAADDYVPKVVAATLGTWEEKSRWFYQVNEPQFDADDATRRKVEELTRGLSSDEEKIAALTHWVADNVRYYGTKQAGACEGYTLHESAHTFRDLGGVCKDKAGMLVTMLRVAGFETYAALTMAGSRVEAIPADQFNHTVTVMRQRDGTFRILDPTWVPLCRDLWSPFEHLQGLVYGTPEGQGLALSPYFEPESNRREVRATSAIDVQGGLKSRMEFTLDGAACNRFRRSIHTRPMVERRIAFEQALNLGPMTRLEKFEHTDPFDYTRDSAISVEVASERFAACGEGGAAFRLPLMNHPLNGFFRANHLDRLKEKERKNPMRFPATRRLRYHETIQLPDGWKIAHTPAAQSIDTPTASLTFEASPAANELAYRLEWTLKKTVISPAEYAGFKSTIDALYAIADDWVVCATERADSLAGKAAEVAGGAGSR